MSEKKFDTDAYHKNIYLLLELAREEYKRHFTELPAIQEKTLKTYLWIGAALLGLQITAIDKLGQIPFASKFWISIAILSAFVTFCFGIDSLRCRKPSVFGIKSYIYLLKNIHPWAREPNSDRKLNVSLINFFETAIKAEIDINVWRASRLRKMSYFLLFSGLATVMTLICFFAG